MKLIVAGSTGFLATEIIRQALHNSAITSVIALGRRETAVPPAPTNSPAASGYDASKLRSVVCENFQKYEEQTKEELAGADACIWTLAVTPAKAGKMPLETARKINHDFPMYGIETMTALAGSRPFRFVYTSGAAAERDQTKRPWVMAEQCLMRGQTENTVIDFAAASKGAVEVSIAKPGLIDAPGRMGMLRSAGMAVLTTVIELPRVQVGEVAAALIKQAVQGVEKETLLNEDLVRIGREELGRSGV